MGDVSGWAAGGEGKRQSVEAEGTRLKFCLIERKIPRSVTPPSSSPPPVAPPSSLPTAAAGTGAWGIGRPFFLALAWRRRSARESFGGPSLPGEVE